MLLLLILIIVEIRIEGRIGHEVLPDDVEPAGVFLGNAIINTLHHIVERSRCAAASAPGVLTEP